MTCRSFEGQGRRGRGGGKWEGEGERRGGREHITRRGGEARDLGRERERERENVMWPAVRPDILLLLRSLGLSMWAGRNGDRKQPPPPPLPPLPPLVLLLPNPPQALHSLRHSLLGPCHPPTNFSYLQTPWLHLPSPGPACFCCDARPKKKERKKKIPFKLYPSTPAPPVFCLSVSIARGGCPPVHHNSLGAEVRRGVLRCE